MRALFFTLLLLAPTLSFAAPPWRTQPMTFTDQQYMEVRRTELNELARLRLGRSFGGKRDYDLRLIQSLLDSGTVDASQTANMQGLGIIMGEFLRKQHALKWVIYNDRVGRSRALEVPDKDEVIFPVTQFSSRAAVGAKIDVFAIYEKLEAEIAQIKKKMIVR